MNSQRWAEIEIASTADAVDAVGQIFLNATCSGYVVREMANPPTISGYLPVDDRLEGHLEAIQLALEKLPDFGITGAGTELTLRYVEEADWATAWKAFYKPIELGRRLLVTPPWEPIAEDNTRLPLIVDPGMAFGTGSHPTTQLCLCALEDYLQPGMSVADVGTGSGILAIAASKLGAKSVIATDIDPLAVSIAAENAEINGVAITTQEEPPSDSYDLVVANILADVIIGLSDFFAARVKPEGLFIASGIIDTRENDVRIAVEAEGFLPLETRRQGEWVALIFRRATV